MRNYEKKIFISSPESNQIEFWEYCNNNGLKKKSILKTKGFSQPLQYCSVNKLLYVGIRPNHNISSYRISKNKELKKIDEFQIHYPLNHIYVNQKKKKIFCSSFHGNCFISLSTDINGSIKKVDQIINSIQGCHSSTLNYNENIICITSLKKDSIYLYNINLFNSLNINLMDFYPKIIKTKDKSGPRHITCHPFENIIYSINEFEGTVDVWKLEEKKLNMILIQSISLIPEIKNKKKPWSSEILIHPILPYLYVSDRNNNIITIFKIKKKNYKLSLHKFYFVEKQPRSFHIDPKGQYLACVGQISNSVSIYKINFENGFLEKKEHSKVGKGPIWINII